MRVCVRLSLKDMLCCFLSLFSPSLKVLLVALFPYSFSFDILFFAYFLDDIDLYLTNLAIFFPNHPKFCCRAVRSGAWQFFCQPWCTCLGHQGGGRKIH